MITVDEARTVVLAVAVALPLRRAQRLGAVEDVPEGVRWIQLSDTLANRLAAELESAAAIHE